MQRKVMDEKVSQRKATPPPRKAPTSRLVNLLHFVGFRSEDGGLLLTLGHVDGGLSLTLGRQDVRTLLTFGRHLRVHGIDHFVGRVDVACGWWVRSFVCV